MSSSPLRPGASRDEELEYYKRQYEQLETDLADYQASSRELEDQLEKDVDAAEKNERTLERAGYEIKRGESTPEVPDQTISPVGQDKVVPVE